MSRMSNFNETDHPRGLPNAGAPGSTRGSFTEKANTSPETVLVEPPMGATEATLRSAIAQYQATKHTIAMASAKRIAEVVLQRHPTAAYIELDEGDYVDAGFMGNEISGSDGDPVAYVEDFETDDGDVAALLSNLPWEPRWIVNASNPRNMIPDPSYGWLVRGPGGAVRLDLLAAARVEL